MTAMMAGPTLPMRVDDRSRSSDCPVLRGGANVESPPTSPRSRSGAFRRPWPSASARDVSTRDASTLFDALKGGVESAPASPTSSRSGAFRRPRQALARLASRGRHSQVSTVSTLRFFDASSPRLEATPAPQERDWTVKIEAWSLPSVRGKGPPLPPNGAQVAQIFQRHWEQIRAARPTERCATAPRSPMEKGSVGQPKIRPKVSPKRERRLPELTFFEKPPEREETDFPRPSETFARLLSNEETANSSPRSEGLEAPVSVQRAISRTRTLTLSRAISEETEGEEPSLSGTREDSKATHRSEEVIPKAPLPFTEEKAAEVFAKLSEYEELHESELSRAMQLLGYMNPNEDWIRTIFRELVPTYNTIQMTEFSSFVKSYAAKHHEACSEAFARYEMNGLMDGPALQKAVQPLGIELLPYVAQEILEEVKQGKPLELSDFEAALPLILQREGFSTKEYEEFQLLFTMNDRDGSGDVDVGELKVMIHWLGFSASHLAPELARKVDRDGSGSLNFVEFLACMRLLRTIELETVQKLMQAAGARDGGDRLEVSHLPSLLNSMGYETWDLQVIEETLEDATLAPCTELELGDVWRFLMEYRRREGFGRQELQEITETFRRHDEDESGELDNLESPLALRMLGFSVGYTEVQSWLLKVDVDESGALNLAELRKLVRMLQAQDMEHFRDVFDAYVRQGFSKGGPPGTLTRENCVRLLELLNFTVPLETFDTVHVTEHQFLTVCYKLIKAQRMECRKNGGWSAQQLKVLRAEYETYASSRDGCVANKDLIRLLEDVLPDMSRDPLFRPELRSILRQVKVDSTGRLGFKEYLTFLQLCRSAKEISVARRQQAAVEETGFSGPEVQELRELFLEAAAPSGITFDGLWKLINSTTPLGHALTTELQELFNEQLMRRTDVHEPPEQALDFADFLRFMRQMMEINFANLVNDPQN